MALRNDPRIAGATKRRVLKIAAELGYKPDAKVTELMAHLRSTRHQHGQACLGVISFYETLRPWDHSLFFARVYDGMKKRADMMGYRLEPFGLRLPGMTSRRLREILDTRGIEGVVCFGSPDMNEELPPELGHLALVSQGLSIRTPLHRVINHGYNDMWRALDRVYKLGYRRPGLAIGDYEEARSAHAHLSAYLGWCNLMLNQPRTIPPFRSSNLEGPRLVSWLRRYKPDVLIFVHLHQHVQALPEALRRVGISIPGDLPVAAISHALQGTGMSGLEENATLMGSRMIELLVAHLASRDFGIPDVPQIEMVESQWVEGQSLPAAARED